jgi:NitT/TauT family transport system ATP-binding protein
MTRERLNEELQRLFLLGGFSGLFITHSIQEACYLSTRVLVMSARPGRIFAEVAIEEPHPRGEAFRGSEAFARHCARLSELLAAASEASVGAKDLP